MLLKALIAILCCWVVLELIKSLIASAFNKDIFPFKKVLYEGIEVNVPHNYEKYAFAEYGMRYLDMPNNMGQAIHYQEFFNTKDQIDLAKKIIEDGVLFG